VFQRFRRRSSPWDKRDSGFFMITFAKCFRRMFVSIWLRASEFPEEVAK
jgi:hypothetical protein